MRGAEALRGVAGTAAGYRPWRRPLRPSPRGGVHGPLVPRPVAPFGSSGHWDPFPPAPGSRSWVLQSRPRSRSCSLVLRSLLRTSSPGHLSHPVHCAPPSRYPGLLALDPLGTFLSLGPRPRVSFVGFRLELEASPPRSVPSRLLWEPGLLAGYRGTECWGCLSCSKSPRAFTHFCLLHAEVYTSLSSNARSQDQLFFPSCSNHLNSYLQFFFFKVTHGKNGKRVLFFKDVCGFHH